MSLLLKYVLLWLPMVVLAVGNGALRDLVYKRYVGERAAHQISTFSLLFVFALYIGYVVHQLPLSSQKQALVVGLLWLALTLCFEFGLGRFNGRSWAELLNDYNILKGRLWILIPLWVTVAPYIFYRLSR